MRPSPALLVAIFVVVAALPVATTAVAAQDGGPYQITSINGTTNQLSVPESELQTAAYESPGVDVGTAVAAGSRRLHQEHETGAFEERFIRANSAEARTELVRDRLAVIEDRRVELETQQGQALSAYATGASSVTGFVEMRALADAEARALADGLRRIERVERNNPDFAMERGLRTDLENTKGNLRMLTGPIAAQLRQSLAGQRDVGVVYLETATDGYMLATIDGGEYVRETHLDDERAPGAEDQFAASEGDRLRNAADRAESLYPWLYDRQLPSVQSFGTTNIYQLTADHSNGRLTAYLDGGTTRVFHEVQSRQLSTVEPTATVTTVDDSTRLTVSRAYETGPLRVAVSNNETGVPLSGTVSISGQPVGATGADGTLWTVEPRGAYNVTVATSDGTELEADVAGR
ncbi:hypothetical protein ACFQJ5_00945 [Halomicroarcula sp. GCM10025324]|uniref:DUF7094 domain-containing protein n=1 Tax=Haloarcula TaxID=2237 RepID=UPI0023E77D6F|nr:hypothetical protein [Halomicroarcula sp. ZS-22-S1]